MYYLNFLNGSLRNYLPGSEPKLHWFVPLAQIGKSGKPCWASAFYREKVWVHLSHESLADADAAITCPLQLWSQGIAVGHLTAPVTAGNSSVLTVCRCMRNNWGLLADLTWRVGDQSSWEKKTERERTSQELRQKYLEGGKLIRFYTGDWGRAQYSAWVILGIVLFKHLYTAFPY